MSGKNSILAVTALFILVVLEAYFLQESFREKNELKTEFSRLLERKNMIQQEFWGAEQMLESARASMREKSDLLSREQAVTRSLRQQLKRGDQEYGNMLDEILRVSREKEELEADFEDARAELDKFKQEKPSALRTRLNDLQKELSESRKTIAMNERELKKINRQNREFSEEKASLKLKAESAESERRKLYAAVQNSRQELQKQTDMLGARQKELLDMETMNKELKKHADQISVLLVKKELEFDDRGKDLQAARAEIAGLSSRIADVEGQLAQARSELEKTTGLLMDVTELSAGLEEKLNPYVQTKKDRNKADELKRKVEVLMSPEK